MSYNTKDMMNDLTDAIERAVEEGNGYELDKLAATMVDSDPVEADRLHTIAMQMKAGENPDRLFDESNGN